VKFNFILEIEKKIFSQNLSAEKRRLPIIEWMREWQEEEEERFFSSQTQL
jgi:hypothetical protein